MEDGLYSSGYQVEFKEGDTALHRDRVQLRNNSNSKQHVIVDGEDLHSIAFKYYGSDHQWFIIADINNVQNPWELEVGAILLIPNLLNIATDV